MRDDVERGDTFVEAAAIPVSRFKLGQLMKLYRRRFTLTYLLTLLLAGGMAREVIAHSFAIRLRRLP